MEEVSRRKFRHSVLLSLTAAARKGRFGRTGIFVSRWGGGLFSDGVSVLGGRTGVRGGGPSMWTVEHA